MKDVLLDFTGPLYFPCPQNRVVDRGIINSLLLCNAQVWVDVKFAGAIYNSEQFNTAGRSIGTGKALANL